MAYTTIDDPSEYFHTQLYTGTGSSQAVTNNANAGNFKPDWLWIKCRSDAASNKLFDSSRLDGSGNPQMVIQTDSNSAENDVGNADFTSIDANGFTVLGANATGASSRTYVAWQWKANGGTTTSFSESGNNPAGTHQANTTAGFSIVTYTGTGGNGTVAHGLGAKPNVMFQKKLSATASWVVYHDKIASDPATDYLELNGTIGAVDYATHFNDTEPTSTVFTVGTDGAVNGDGVTNVMYCFTEIKGYSKFGSYTGNGAQDGTFVYTGFKPAWILIKRTDTNGKNWYIADSTRSPSNITKAFLSPNLNSAEDTSGDATDAYFDILSNGFKLRQDFSHLNASGATHIYMAFAEHPFVSSKGVPTTAR
jgi:hypothetical protein